MGELKKKKKKKKNLGSQTLDWIRIFFFKILNPFIPNIVV